MGQTDSTPAVPKGNFVSSSSSSFADGEGHVSNILYTNVNGKEDLVTLGNGNGVVPLNNFGFGNMNNFGTLSSGLAVMAIACIFILTIAISVRSKKRAKELSHVSWYAPGNRPIQLSKNNLLAQVNLDTV